MSNNASMIGRVLTEIVLLTAPIGFGVVVAVSIGTIPDITIRWLLSGWSGLAVAVWSGRESSLPTTLVEWPRPQTAVDILTATIAYHGVLGLGVLVSGIAWGITNSTLLAFVLAAVLPVWFLKHLYLLVFALDDGREDTT